MARMHSRRKGKSGSHRPFITKNPDWVTHKPNEIEALIVKFAKERMTSAQIGLHLRDVYGIPSVRLATGKTVMQIMQEKKVAKKLPQDLLDLIQKLIDVNKHYEDNKQDKTSLRGIELTRSKINRLIRYYKESGKLAQEWKFDSSKAGMYLE